GGTVGAIHQQNSLAAVIYEANAIAVHVASPSGPELRLYTTFSQPSPDNFMSFRDSEHGFYNQGFSN
ncbi:MAG TPA: hypothetical protein VET69_14855, partial [Terriglobales bacterium]|nr:hypothetical protein [Terriglobales bacterium]